MKQLRCFYMIAAGSFFAAACPAQQGAILDGLVAVVNNSVITDLQVEDPIMQALDRAYHNNPANFNAMRKQLLQDQLESLEQVKLILDDFARGEYTTNWVDDAVADAMKRELKETFGGSHVRLVKTLQDEGLTLADYRKQKREKVIVEAMGDLHAGNRKIIISPAAIEKYYNDHLDEYKVEDQVKLRTICIPQSPDSHTGASKELAEEILRKIDGGVPFDEMAKVYSYDEHRHTGGDWGWVQRKDLAAALREAAFSLKAGQHSPIVELPDERTRGATICYLLMVDDVRPPHVSALSEVQGSIEQTLQAKRGSALLHQWIERLKAKSLIENFQ